jgi:tetratricopeptide (TPR) repeat protein
MSAEEKKKKEQVTSPAHIAAAKSAASQRRHQLESNTLASSMKKVVEALKEGPSRTTWIVIGLVATAVILFYVWRYFSHNSEEKNSARWFTAMRVFEGDRITPPKDDEKLALPPRPEDELAKFAKDNEGTMQARIARFDIARISLAEGERFLGSNRERALEQIRKAAELFEKLQGESSDIPILHIEAIFKAGKAREMNGEFNKAIEQYEKLLKEYPKSAFKEEAEAAKARLKEGSATRAEAEALFKNKGGL